MSNALPLAPKKLNQRIFRTRPEDALPLTVEHQRIYIVPSRRGLAFLLALLVCLVASINYQLNLGYGLSFLLAGLFAASLLHTYRNLAGIRLESIHASPATCGDPAKFTLRLSNPSAQERIGIDIVNDEQTIRSDISIDQTTTTHVHAPTHKRGYLPLGRLTFTSQYPLGLWTTWSYCHAAASALVHPLPESNPPPLPRAFADGAADFLHMSQTGDVANLRDYQPGDPLTRVAWKRAAQSGELYVREMEENNPGGDVELSIAATDLHDVEQQMSRLAAWVDEAHQSGSAFSLSVGSQQFEAGSGDAHRLTCLRALSLYKNNSAES